MRGAVRVDEPVVELPLERHGDDSGRLEDLEGKVQIHDAGDAGDVALREGVGGRAAGEVFGALFGGPGLVRDGASWTSGDDGTAGKDVKAGDVVLQIGGRSGTGLPDALEIGLAIRGAGDGLLRKYGGGD